MEINIVSFRYSLRDTCATDASTFFRSTVPHAAPDETAFIQIVRRLWIRGHTDITSTLMGPNTDYRNVKLNDCDSERWSIHPNILRT